MSLHVLFTVNRCAKALFAERTLVRLQAHVCGHVPREAAIGGEGGTADAAAEGLDPCINRQSKEGNVSLHYPGIVGIQGQTSNTKSLPGLQFKVVTGYCQRHEQRQSMSY